MIDIPHGRQTFGYDCGAKALQVVLAYYGIDVREDRLIRELNCDHHGTPVRDMIAVAEKKGFKVRAEKGMSLEAVKACVDANYPVIILLQAWADADMTLDDWKGTDEHGHYVVVIGHYGNIVVFRDPSSFSKTWMTEEELTARWHGAGDSSGERLDRFAIVLLGKRPSIRELVHMD